MKIMSNSSLPTSNIRPTVASKNEREIFAAVPRMRAARQNHGKKSEHDADNLEE